VNTPEDYLVEAKELLKNGNEIVTETMVTNRALIQELLYAFEDVLTILKYKENPGDILRLENRLNAIRQNLKAV